MATIVFYGAGQNARDNYAKWKANGLTPVCFADADLMKHHTLFNVPDSSEQIEILSLLEVMERYPDYELYLTQIKDSLVSVSKQLIGIGVPQQRIKCCEPLEVRYGCDLLGKTLLADDYLMTCCVVFQMGPYVKLGSSMEENYSRWVSLCDGIVENWRQGKVGACAGCCHLRYDVWAPYTDPEMLNLNICTRNYGDICNAACKYCRPEMGNAHPSVHDIKKRKKEVLDFFHFFETRFPENHFNIIINCGEIAVASFSKELFEIIARNDWDADVFTNGFIYVEEIAELLSSGKGQVSITLESLIPEKYAEIKGRDRLPTVLQNIKKYSKSAKNKSSIRLKLIILDNTYESFDEIKDIIDFANDIGATLILSCDVFNSVHGPLSAHELGLAVMFVRYAKELKLNLIILYSNFNLVDAKVLEALANKL